MNAPRTNHPSGVLARPEAELRRTSNGREPWVFRAAAPNELLGVHAELIGRALESGETLAYLLYAPMWEGRGGPFGIRGRPASHAVVVSDRRFLVSSDPHLDGERPAVHSIPFSALLRVESGSAGTLAWLVIVWAAQGGVRSLTVLYRALGRRHIAAVIREWRAAARPGSGGPDASGRAWPAVWHRLDELHRGEVEPLVVEGERPLAAVSWPAVLDRPHRRHGYATVRAVPAGAVIVSNLGVITVGDDFTAAPGGVGLAVNAVAIPADALRRVAFADATTSGPWVTALRFELERDGVATTSVVRFPGERLEQVEVVLRMGGELPALREVAWSS